MLIARDPIVRLVAPQEQTTVNVTCALIRRMLLEPLVLRVQPHIGCGTGMAVPRIVACLVLIPPKIVKPPRRQFGIFYGMLDVAMPQEELDGPRILFIVGQLKAAAMPELMRMHREA